MLRFALAALSVLLFVAAAPAAQEPTRVEESAEVTLVEVPVRVLDRHGNPLRDLTEKDFALYDDGKRQEIVAFDRIDLAQKGIEPGSPEAINPAARRHFLLLFDLSFAKPKAVLAARRAAKEFVLSGMGSNDFAAVATFSVERGVRLLVTFSSDRVQLARAIDTLGLTEGASLVSDPLSFVYDVIRVQASEGGGGGDSSQTQRKAETAGILEYLETIASLERARLDGYERGRVARLTDSLGEVATALDTIQGRKDIIYLSEGFQTRLLVGANETSQEHDWKIGGEAWKVDVEKTYGNSYLQAQLKAMADLFRRSDCVIHAVDIAGLQNDSAPDYQATQLGHGENALFEIANATGGDVLRNDNDFRAQLERLIARTNLVYVLSFRPKRTAAADRFHQLKVKVNVSGARAFARAGYYERPVYRMLSPLERSLLAADVIANEIPVAQIPVSLLGAPMPNGSGPARVPVLIEVSGPELLAQDRGSRASAEIYVYAHDAERRLRDFFTQVVQIDLGINRERLERGGLRYEGQLTLPPGDYRVRALVRNGATGRMGLAAEAIHVPDFSEKAPYLARPFFMESSADGIFVRGRSGAGAGAAEAAALPVARPDLVPSALPEVRPGTPAQLSVVAYNFGDARALKIGAQVLSEEGRPLTEGAIRVIGQSSGDPDGSQVLMVSFTPEQLSPGSYALRVFLRDAATGKAGYASAPFRVR
ncbi:MAG: VWA domain-containing protein [Acidobacteriota bacterium]